MQIKETKLKGCFIIEPRVFSDSRGCFYEAWNKKTYEELGIARDWKQDNISHSNRGVLRGLHVQIPNFQAKLVSVLAGEVFDVAVDLRKDSSTFGNWFGTVLSSENRHQVFIPEGFAHGFYTLSSFAIFSYKCSEKYDPKGEYTLLWNDLDIDIKWPLLSENPHISEKDTVNAKNLSTFES